MKLSAQEEYGLRCLLHVARCGEGPTIPEISMAEGLSEPYVAKLMRVLRIGGFVKSARGQVGGYVLARPADQIIVSDTLDVLGGRLFESNFCERHAGNEQTCNHSVDCAVRSLWRAIQGAVDDVASKLTLRDLLSHEQQVTSLVKGKF
ncbi:MAG TPA: Rrf2 family transcriptional regulator [Blastocatellia bacterium]|nr:Rrf2 family transcriptional regulator [Blastocatellia bacterium]